MKGAGGRSPSLLSLMVLWTSGTMKGSRRTIPVPVKPYGSVDERHHERSRRTIPVPVKPYGSVDEPGTMKGAGGRSPSLLSLMVLWTSGTMKGAGGRSPSLLSLMVLWTSGTMKDGGGRSS